MNRTLRAQLEVCSETESQLKSQILGLERKAAERQVLIESYEENVEQFSRDLLCYQENTAGRLDTARDESEQLRVKVVELSGALEEERTRRIERAQAFQELEARYTKLHQQSTEEAASSSKRESELAARATKAVTEAERLGTLLRDATARSNSLKLESNRLVREQNEASRRHQGEQEGLREKLMAGEKERRAQQREHELKVDGLFGDLKVEPFSPFFSCSPSPLSLFSYTPLLENPSATLPLRSSLAIACTPLFSRYCGATCYPKSGAPRVSASVMKSCPSAWTNYQRRTTLRHRRP